MSHCRSFIPEENVSLPFPSPVVSCVSPCFSALVLLALYPYRCIAQPSRAPAAVPTLSACAVRFDIGWASHFFLETLPSCPARLFNWYVMRSVRETLTLSLDRLLSVWVCENDWLVEDVILKPQEMLRGKLVSFHRRRLVRCWFNLGYSREYLEGDDPLWRRETFELLSPNTLLPFLLLAILGSKR